MVVLNFVKIDHRVTTTTGTILSPLLIQVGQLSVSDKKCIHLVLVNHLGGV